MLASGVTIGSTFLAALAIDTSNVNVSEFRIVEREPRFDVKLASQSMLTRGL